MNQRLLVLLFVQGDQPHFGDLAVGVTMWHDPPKRNRHSDPLRRAESASPFRFERRFRELCDELPCG